MGTIIIDSYGASIGALSILFFINWCCIAIVEHVRYFWYQLHPKDTEPEWLVYGIIRMSVWLVILAIAYTQERNFNSE